MDLANLDATDVAFALNQLGRELGQELCLAVYLDSEGSVLFRGLRFRPRPEHTTNPTDSTEPRSDS